MKTHPSAVKVLTALLTPIPEKQEEFLQTIRSLHLAIQKEPGCLECVFGRDLSGEPRFVLFMVWKDLQALEAHMATENFRILVGATSVLSAPADFRFITADSAGDASDAAAAASSPRRPRRPTSKAS